MGLAKLIMLMFGLVRLRGQALRLVQVPQDELLPAISYLNKYIDTSP